MVMVNGLCHVWCFYSLFTFLVHFWLQMILVRTTSMCLLKLVNLQFRLACFKFSFNRSSVLLIEGLNRFCQEDKHAPNKQCALNNNVRLITWFYDRKPVAVSSNFYATFRCLLTFTAPKPRITTLGNFYPTHAQRVHLFLEILWSKWTLKVIW